MRMTTTMRSFFLTLLLSSLSLSHLSHTSLISLYFSATFLSHLVSFLANFSQDDDDEERGLLYSDEAESDRDEGEQRRRKEAKKRQLAAQNAAGSGDFTRSEALRTLPLYLLCIDKFFSAIIGAGCSQVFMQVLKENGAD